MYNTNNLHSDNSDQEDLNYNKSQFILADKSDNNNLLNFFCEKKLVEMIEDQARLIPNKKALIFEGKSISYKELNDKAGIIADQLISMGAKNNQFIACYFNQSIERIICMLGILKSGAAYIPLETHYPIDRINFLLGDSDSLVLITSRSLISIEKEVQIPVFAVEDMLFETTQKSPLRSTYADTHFPSDLMYVLHTSGTTGKPKGVQIEHRSISNFLTEYNKLLEIDIHDYTLQFSPYNFDVSMLEIWLPLSKGATVCLYPNNKFLGDYLSDFILSNSITVIPFISPTVLATISHSIAFPLVKVIGVGGEVCPVSISEYWMRKLKLVNLYGPTEATVSVNSYIFEDSHPANTIGVPIANTKFYVLDNNFKPVSKGDIGELYISGIPLARGYLNQPELTAEKFMANPFVLSDDEDYLIYSRLYKTGDQVRVLPDNYIEYIGRADNQIKIRGYRVELFEIEESIKQSGLVENCCVIVKGDNSDDKQLICFYKNNQGTETTPEDVREYVSACLPFYMIPSRILRIPSFPFTINGKLDRKALSNYEADESERESYAAPENQLQKQITDIWQNLLSLTRIGIRDNFFYFGGNSISAYKLTTAIRADLGISIRISDVFLYPTIEELAGYIETNTIGNDEDIIAVGEVNNNPVKLSSQQQSLWFLDQLYGSLPYHIGVSIPIKGDISVSLLDKAFHILIQKHSIFRTIISEDKSTAFQSLISDGYWQLQNIHHPSSTIFRELLQAPFDLKRDYMLKAYLVYESDLPVSLYMIIHHIAIDGWSMSLLISELNKIYLQLKESAVLSAEDYPIQYRDYAYWQTNHLNHKRLESGVLFWENYLADVPVLQLPYDFPKQPLYNDKGNQYCFTINEYLTTQLSRFAEDNHTTLYTVLLSAFGLLMQYYSGQDDICIGTPVANRIPSSVDKTMGYFVNMLPLRIRIDGNPVYSEYFGQIRNMLTKVFQYQDIPLETIIKYAAKDRYVGHNPLFQSVFILQDAIDYLADNSPIDGSRMEWVFNGKSKFDIQFEVIPVKGRLNVTIEYACALFKDETIERMSDSFIRVLQLIIECPENKIGDFRILDRPAQSGIPIVREEDFSTTIVDRIERQVKRTPDKTALIFEGRSLSYLQLDVQSSLIADQLIAKGIHNGQFVACYLDQSIERIICLLAILKAGAAYVPLDIHYPIERINLMLNDTAPKLLITASRLKSIGKDISIPIHTVEDLLDNPIFSEPHKNTYADTHTSSDLIYVIHTSGTTGVPKGVLIEHRAISNFITQYNKLLEIGEEDHTLQFSPYNFDGSVIDIWLPLVEGATIHLYPNNKLLGDYLSDFLLLNKVTIVPFVSPSVLSTIPVSASLPNLKAIGTGGEACPSAVSRHWIKQVKLVNVYGPTETTVAVNRYVFDDRHPANTIGKPIDNMRFYVLDRYLREVPVGVPGELHISGIQLSRGYLNQPELTSEKFIDNPLLKHQEVSKSIFNKLYKTGDLVRILPDSNIEFAGRKDQQVKVRGYRIEITEIETVLQRIPEIKSAVVQVIKSGENIVSLRAYIVGCAQISEIKDILGKQLPSYMIPNEFIPVDSIPVTSNGKVDSAALALQAEEYLNSITPEEEDIPLSQYEQVIRDIWSQVLQCRIPSLDRDFFQMGGHSLLLTKLYNRLCEHFPNKFSLSELYINNTVRKLAHLLEYRDQNPTQTIEHYGLGSDPLSFEIKKDACADAAEFKFELKDKGNFTNPEVILLTGVTGFVGINLLVEFLQSTSAVIYLLIRAKDEEQAERRLMDTLDNQLIDSALYDKKRVRLLAGDLSKPLLGLSPDLYAQLSQSVDVIYHAGSSVNFIQPYSYMKAANVDALRVLIKLATTSRLKQICLLSTIGVFSWEHYFTKPAMIMEADSIQPAFKYLSRDMGYIQSKWVMEQVAQQAIEQGVPIVIFRLGYVFCHSLTGATARYQWWGLLVRTCIELKTYPILIDQREELVSVDFISKAVAYISKNPDAAGQIFHLCPHPKDNMPMMEFFETLKAEFGFELKAVPYREWMSLWENDENSLLYPLLSLFKFEVYDHKSIIEINQDTPHYDISNTIKFLEKSNIENTAINTDMLREYCKYLGVI